MNEETIRAARVALIHRRPYLAAALWSLRLEACPGLGTMAVSSDWVLSYDTDLSWSVEETAGVLYHEVWHLLADHLGRWHALGADRTKLSLWNLACDAAVNELLVEEGVTLPSGYVTPSSLALPPRRTAEEYFRMLLEHASRRAGLGPTSATAGRASLAAGEGRSEAPRRSVCAGRCGGIVGGEERAEDGKSADDGSGWTSRFGAEVMRRAVAAAVLASAPGSVPGALRRWAEGLHQPSVDWRRELAEAVRRAVGQASGMVDYSYRRPSRRQSVVGPVVLPSLYRPQVEVAIVVDTSGSVSDELLAAALAETDAILAANGRAKATVYAVDAAVQAVSRVASAERVTLQGGGGTDMGKGIAAAMAGSPLPDVIIVLTDGYTPWPKQPPAVPVVVGLLCCGGRPPQAPPWARTVVIDAP